LLSLLTIYKNTARQKLFPVSGLNISTASNQMLFVFLFDRQ